MPVHCVISGARTFNYFPAAPWKKSSCSALWSQRGCALVPIVPPSPLPDFASRGLGTPFRQGLHPAAPAPIHPTSTPHRRPKTTAPRTLPHPTALLCEGSSSARLLSGAAPQHVLYAQADDTEALARQPRQKDNNVLPRSFINTLSSPSQPHGK